MCLILFAYRQQVDYPLVVIANRDEYYARPTRPSHWWDDADIFAGRDLEASGTWLGVNRRGHFAAVTNVREPGSTTAGNRSRGNLTRDYLAGHEPVEVYLQRLSQHDEDYAGFNLLLGDRHGLWFYSNRDHRIQSIEPGIYGISNGKFDEPWPKLSSGKNELGAMLNGNMDADQLMEILTDHRVADDHELPSTGVSIDIERLLSSRFIHSAEYGTRASSVVMMNKNHRIDFREQNFTTTGIDGDPITESFSPVND